MHQRDAATSMKRETDTSVSRSAQPLREERVEKANEERSRVPSRVALYGNFGASNLGNECTLAAAIDGLARRLGRERLYCIAPGAEGVVRLHGIDAIAMDSASPRAPLKGPGPTAPLRLLKRIHWEWAELRRALRLTAGTKAFLVTGTGILEDDTGSLGWFLAILRWTLAARLRNAAVGFVSIGAGPVRPGLPRLILRIVLAMAHYVSYRDGFSRDWMHRIGVEVRNHFIAPDLAFGLTASSESLVPRGESEGPRVAVGVMNIVALADPRVTASSEESYLARMTDLLIELIPVSAGVDIVYGDSAYDDRLANILLNRCTERLRACSASRVVLRASRDYEELMTILSQQDVVLAPRYHNLILALLFGKPVIALAYHEKHRDLLAQFGLDRFVHDLLDFDPKRVATEVLEAFSQRHALRERIRSEVESAWQRLEEQYERLVDLCA